MRTQKGFTTFEFFVVVIVACLIAASGYLVYTRQDEPTTNSNDSSITTEKPENITTESTKENIKQEQVIPAGWVMTTSAENTFTIAVPSNWVGKTWGHTTQRKITEWKHIEKYDGYVVGSDANQESLKLIETTGGFGSGLSDEEAKQKIATHPTLKTDDGVITYLFGFSDAEYCSTKIIFKLNDELLGEFSIGGSSPTQEGDISCNEVNKYEETVIRTLRIL